MGSSCHIFPFEYNFRKKCIFQNVWRWIIRDIIYVSLHNMCRQSIEIVYIIHSTSIKDARIQVVFICYYHSKNYSRIKVIISSEFVQLTFFDHLSIKYWNEILYEISSLWFHLDNLSIYHRHNEVLGVNYMTNHVV